jgi:hypothetical protein
MYASFVKGLTHINPFITLLYNIGWYKKKMKDESVADIKIRAIKIVTDLDKPIASYNISVLLTGYLLPFAMIVLYLPFRIYHYYTSITSSFILLLVMSLVMTYASSMYFVYRKDRYRIYFVRYEKECTNTQILRRKALAIVVGIIAYTILFTYIGTDDIGVFK